MKTIATAAALTLLTLLLPLRASADCVATLSASASGSSVTFTATASGGNCGGTTVAIVDPELNIEIAKKDCPTTTCEVTVTRNNGCRHDGQKTMTAWASCSRQASPADFCNFDNRGNASAEYPVKVTPPTSSLVLSGPNAAGDRTFTVSYDFSATGQTGGRVELYHDGHFQSSQNVGVSGVWQGALSTACISGTHTYQALAVSACGFNDGYPKFFGPSNIVTITAPKPAVSLSATPPQAIVHYSFPGTTSAAQRTLRIISAMTGLVIAETHPTDVSGDWPWTIPACQIGAESEMVLARAISCGGETAESETALMIPECDTSCSTTCPSCVGQPIRVTNGNMRLTDHDPLPGAPLAPLVRNYDSRSPVIGAFGKGWSSPFDAWLRSHSGSDGRQIVMMGTERGDRFVFVRHGTAYTQVWPSGEQTSGTLTYDASAATFTHREAGASVVRIFRASDGRLVAVRSLAGQYQVGITYTGGKPTRVDDSRGTLGWTITTNANGLVDTISIDGQPGIVWSYLYDSAGNLQTVKIGTLVWRSYTYGSAGLTEARDGEGRLIESHTYDSSGNALDSAGATDDITGIAYNAAGARGPAETVTRVSYATGRTTDYFSRFVGGKMRTVELKGSCACGTDDATYVYDGDGHTVREQNASGYVTVSSYDASTGNLLSTSTAMKPAACDPATAADRCRLDPDALAAASLAPTSATVTTTFAYGDPNWPDRPTVVNTTSVVAGKQRRETRAYQPVTGELAAAEIDGFRPPGDQIASATMTTFYGDPAGASGGDTDGAPPVNPLAPAFDPGGSFASAWLSLPQPAGFRRSADGARNDVNDLTSFVYYPIDSSVPALLRGRLAATKNAAGHIARFESYDVFGNVTRTVDPNGVATESSHDALGRVLTTTVKAVPGCDTSADALCATDLTTTFTYYPAGPLKSEQRPSGGVTVYTYDSRGRTATLSRGPAATDLREQIETTYDAATGRKSLERYLAWENGAWAEKKRESYAYDSFARLTTVTHADGASAGYTYDEQGRIQSARDENHPAPNTTYAYDPAGRLLTVRQTLGAGQITTSYAYDVSGNLTSVTDPNGNVTSYEFDDLGRMLKQTSAVTGVTTYEYDAAGDLISTVDANGAKTVRAYDALGRVVSAVASRSATATETVTWTYDNATAGRFGVGRLASMTDPAGATSYAYDRRGLLRSETRTFTDTAYVYTTGFHYDADGNRSAIAYPSGQLTVAYSYDYAGRPLTASGVVTGAEYRPFGPLTMLHFANGTTQTLDQDNRYRIASNELAIDGAPPGQGRIARYVFGYDAAGNITNLQDAIDPAYHRTLVYDDLNRLTRANTPPNGALWETATYSWDALGNIVSTTMARTTPAGPENLAITNPKRFQPPNKPKKKGQSSLLLGRTIDFTYAGSTSLLSSVAFNGLSHGVASDAAGNETSYFATRNYSPRNLLSEVHDQTDPEEEAPHVLRYGYDGRGLRVERTETPSHGVGTSVHRFFLYTPELTLLAGTRDDGQNDWGGNPPTTLGKNIDYEIVWFGDRPVAQVAPGSTPLFTFADHLGTPLLQTDSSRNVTWRVEYEPFGNVYEVRAGTRTDQPLRFPGQDMAMTWEGAEENDNIFRWYRAGWGRYTQADPFGLAGDLNLYAYASDNAVRNTDWNGLAPVPTGHRKECGADDWRYCEVYCGGRRVEACATYWRPRSHTRTRGGTVLTDITWEKTFVECNCEDKRTSCMERIRHTVDDLNRWLDRHRPPIFPPLLPPPFPVNPQVPEPVLPGLPPFFINPCLLNPNLCFGQGGIA